MSGQTVASIKQREARELQHAKWMNSKQFAQHKLTNIGNKTLVRENIGGASLAYGMWQSTMNSLRGEIQLGGAGYDKWSKLGYKSYQDVLGSEVAKVMAKEKYSLKTLMTENIVNNADAMQCFIQQLVPYINNQWGGIIGDAVKQRFFTHGYGTWPDVKESTYNDKKSKALRRGWTTALEDLKKPMITGSRIGMPRNWKKYTYRLGGYGQFGTYGNKYLGAELQKEAVKGAVGYHPGTGQKLSAFEMLGGKIGKGGKTVPGITAPYPVEYPAHVLDPLTGKKKKGGLIPGGGYIYDQTKPYGGAGGAPRKAVPTGWVKRIQSTGKIKAKGRGSRKKPYDFFMSPLSTRSLQDSTALMMPMCFVSDQGAQTYAEGLKKMKSSFGSLEKVKNYEISISGILENYMFYNPYAFLLSGGPSANSYNPGWIAEGIADGMESGYKLILAYLNGTWDKFTSESQKHEKVMTRRHKQKVKAWMKTPTKYFGSTKNLPYDTDWQPDIENVEQKRKQVKNLMRRFFGNKYVWWFLPPSKYWHYIGAAFDIRGVAKGHFFSAAVIQAYLGKMAVGIAASRASPSPYIPKPTYKARRRQFRKHLYTRLGYHRK